MGGAAMAQDSGGGKPGQKVQEVVVTGSRLGRPNLASTPNPVTVLGAQDIQKLGITNVGDVLAQLPENSNFFAANNVGLGNFNVGAQLANLRGLNPFFGTRTLTLVDTQRVVPTTTGGGVDVTLIPSMLVARTETDTGGASAVYGSDAVAGVVNIILDTKLQGFKGQADFSQTSRGDGADWHASAAYGSDFAGGRGHVVMGGEFEKYDAIGICDRVRDWCATNYAMFTNVNYNTPGAPGYGQPHYILGTGGTTANQSLTGVLTPCTFPYAGACVNVTGFPFFTNGQMQFNAAGNGLMAYNPGNYAPGAGFFGFSQSPDPESVGAYDTTTMRPAVTRFTALIHADYDVNDHIQAFVEGWAARSEAENPVANGAIGPYSLEVAPSVFVGAHITPDNAFLTPAEAAFIGPNGAEFGRDVANVIEARNRTNNDTYRFTVGGKGDISGSWGWDAYAEFGLNDNNQHLYNSVVNGGGLGYDFMNFALDAVHQTPGDPTSPIVCRATDPAYGPVNPLAAGCAPLNLFGTGNASQAALNYVFRTLQEYSTYTQVVASGNIHGDLSEGWGAGPIKLAAGAEVRHEHGDVTHDLQDQPFYDQYVLSYGLDYSGSIDVLEGYTELNVPLIKDAPLAHYAELDGAFRETQNRSVDLTEPSPLGGNGAPYGASKTTYFNTWKVSGVWDITDWLRLRGTRSRDVRAPQFRELFESYAVGAGPFGSVTNPWDNNITNQTTITTGGNVNLKPEKADTWTTGIVLSPKSGLLEGLQLSADWYQIRIKDVIVGPPFGIGAQNIVNECFAGIQAFCALMGGAGTDKITFVDNNAANLGAFTTRGIDFEGDYSLPLDRVQKDLNGTFSVRVLASYLYDMIIDAGFGAPPFNYAGQSGPTGAFGGFNTSPKWQGNAYLTYSTGPFTGTVQLHYIGPGKFETITAIGGVAVAPGDPGYSTTNPNSINNNRVPSAVYVNLAVNYTLPFHNQAFQLFGTVNNVFNKSPPMAPGGNGYPTNPVYFDTYGTLWKMGLRMRF
jgi:iron complex outermembrane receptor protein